MLYLPYVMFRFALRILGSEKRIQVLNLCWPNRFTVPAFLPLRFRRWVGFESWLEEMDSRLDAEPKVRDQLLTMHGALFVDLGANVGCYPRLLAKNFQRIVAVEADQVVFKHLQKRVPRNCECLLAAASANNGPVQLKRVSGFPEIDDVLEVNGISLADLLSTRGVADVIKVDVEGAEWAVIEGAKSVMHQISSWIIELHDLNRARELELLMERFSYSCRWLDSSHAFFYQKPAGPSIS
jgi:FkbM family methyltransferase